MNKLLGAVTIAGALLMAGATFWLWQRSPTPSTAAPLSSVAANAPAHPPAPSRAESGSTFATQAPEAAAPTPSLRSLPRSPPQAAAPAGLATSKRIVSRLDFGKQFQEILAKGEPLSNADLASLQELVLACGRAQAIVNTFQSERVLRQETQPPVTPDQARALGKLESACQGIPAEDRANGGARFEQELYARDADDPRFQVRRIETLIRSGQGTRAVDHMEQLLANPDPLVMRYLADVLQERLGESGIGAELQPQGLPLDRLRVAWNLVSCDMSGGCGPDSFNAQVDCLMLNQCDFESQDQSIRRFLHPDALRAIQNWRERIHESYRTGDWGWLGLERLRRRYGA